MNHAVLRLSLQLILYALYLTLPFMIIAFSDRFRRQPTPSEYAALFVVVAVIGVLLFIPAVSIIAATALLAVGVARLSARYALDGLTYERHLQPSRLFPGDEGELVVRLENRKILPLGWLSVTDPIQFGLIRAHETVEDWLKISGGIETLDNLGNALITRTAVGPFQSVTRRYGVKALQRGAYSFGPPIVETGDPFGIFRREKTLGQRMEVMVYPRLFGPDEIGLPFREIMGEMVTRRTLFEDPTLLAGSRDYQPGDPLSRMHWKATARSSQLQVRVNDPSTTAQLMIVLNLNTFQHIWQGVDLDRMEATIEVAASLATWGLEHDYAVGLHSNGIVPGLEKTPRVAPSAHPRQQVVLLEHLARLAFSGRFSPEDVLVSEADRLQAGGSVIFITAIITPALVSVLTSRQLRGRASVVYCGRFAAPVVRGLPIHLITPFGERARAIS